MTHEVAIDLDGLTLRGWRRCGSGPRCLALHGWLDNAGTFSRLADCLPDWDFLALDLPGHGRSDFLPHPAVYHFIDGIHWVLSVLENWGPSILLGHSMGGGIGSMAAGLSPHVRALIVLDALGPLTTPADEAPQLFRRSWESGRKTFRRRYYATREEALQRVRTEGHSPEAAQALAERSLVSDATGWYYRYDPRLKQVSRARLTEEQIRAFLREVHCPVQVQSFLGGLLPKFSPTAERLQCLPQAQFVELPGGHHLHLEQPALVASKILEFTAALA